MRVSCFIVLGVVGASCVPPTLHFYQAPPDTYTTISTLTDTLFVKRIQPADSTVHESVHLIYDLLDRAETTQQVSTIQMLKTVLASIPEADRARGPKPGSQDASIITRLSQQKSSYQYDLARADALFVESVFTDTLTREIVITPEHEFEEPEVVAESWIALLLNVRAVFDPEFGRRADVQ